MTSTRERMSLLQKVLDIDEFEDALGLEVMKTLGDEDICRCPLPSHDGYDANPSFSLNRSKLIYNCFACGVGGTIIDLVARVRDVDYDEAYQFCRSYDDGGDGPHRVTFGERLAEIFAREHETEAVPSPLPRFSKSILKDWVSDYSGYFESRGISRESQDKYVLGYDEHHTRGDYIGPAAIIPHFFKNDLVGYQERWIDDNRPKTIPKYTNSKNFPKKETLFGFDFVVDGNRDEPVVVVESALTAIYLDQIGFPAVATFGAQVTDEQIYLLRSFSWGVILSFDNDAAGAAACEVVGQRLKKTIPVHVTPQFGAEKADLNDLTEQEVVGVIQEAKPWFIKEL